MRATGISRRTELKRQKLFDAALAAARDIAVGEGLPGLQARRIARRVRCSVGTVYNVFGNMDTLILHLNGTTLDALYEELSATESDGEPEDAIRAMARTYLDFILANLNLWNVIFEHVWPRDYDIPDWYHDKIRRLLGLLIDALAPLFAPHEEAQKIQAAAVLWGGLHGIFSLAAADKLGIVTSGNVTAMSDMLVSNFIAGLRRHGGG